jgi:hypothetical protein
MWEGAFLVILLNAPKRENKIVLILEDVSNSSMQSFISAFPLIIFGERGTIQDTKTLFPN